MRVDRQRLDGAQNGGYEAGVGQHGEGHSAVGHGAGEAGLVHEHVSQGGGPLPGEAAPDHGRSTWSIRCVSRAKRVNKRSLGPTDSFADPLSEQLPLLAAPAGGGGWQCPAP
jgi:hypothetical protein